jgi:SAM-dependent methyltransferase
MPPHDLAQPSDWVTRWAPLVPAGCAVLDLACGSGRHVRWWAARGHRVTGVDRDASAIAPLADIAEIVVADLESGPWPLPGRRYGAVVVTNYLWRPLWPQILGSLEDGGVLIYETFAQGQAAIGRPSRPEFLLQPGELLQRCANLRIVGYEDGFLMAPPRCVQRIAAVHETTADSADLPRYRLPDGPPCPPQ